MAQGQGMSFSSLDPKELEKKVRTATTKTPFIYSQAWNSTVQIGNPATYHVWVRNPDPVAYHPVYATIYFGLGNILTLGEGWIGRDKRWPEFSSDRTFMGPFSSHRLTFGFHVPEVPLGTYNGNTVVWRGMWHDTGTSLDRGGFDIKVLPAVPMSSPTPMSSE
ncbi:hypothetical protein [Enhygromyxa salina]|nr:hypothetical protein [Enhygromyxa salina]